MDATEDAAEAYDHAQQRAVLAREQWAKAGEPFTLEQPSGRIAGHPLWKALLEAEGFAARLREKLLAPRQTGRPLGAASAADRTAPPPRVKLVALPTQEKNGEFP